MTKRIGSVAVLSALALLAAGCGDEGESAEDSARETATSVADRAEAVTRLKATLTGAAEAPAAGDPDATGTATVNLDVSKGEVCYEVAAQKIAGPTGMHIHEGEAGKAGPVVVTLTTPTATDPVIQACTNADRALMGRIAAQPANFYVNVHSGAYPQGALRGQLSQ